MPTHFELCKAVAERLAGKAWIVLYEYQSYATNEFPDVLIFTGRGTTLFEIKISRSDFLADAKKEARKKWRPKVGLFRLHEKADLQIRALAPELYYIERPHFGSRRYFVCEPEIIQRTELPEGWGLYWFKCGRMFKKAESKKWRPDVHSERNILAHALCRYASGDHTGIIVKTYSGILL